MHMIHQNPLRLHSSTNTAIRGRLFNAQRSNSSGAPSLSPLKTENRKLKTPSAFTLIELLIVIAIIGILMSLLFPAVNSAIDAARKAQAKNDAVQIATAITAYETEYGRLPLPVSTAVNTALVAVLAGLPSNTNNPRGIVFLEVQAAKKGKSGTNASGFVDPWGGAYNIIMDSDYDNTLANFSVPKTSGSGSDSISGLRKKVAVWNTTSNARRAVRSWE